MKAGLVAIAGAVRGLKAMGLAPRAPVDLQSVVEEECSGNGALACVLAGRTADAVILTEPTSGGIQNSQVGVLWFGVRVRGKPAHAGDAPEGQNAIEAVFPIVAALRDLEAELNDDPPAPYDVYPHPINLNVGVIRGGDWPSTVAGESVTQFRLALYPGTGVENLKRRVEETVSAAAAADPVLAGFEVEVLYDGFACEGFTLEPDAPVTGALERGRGAGSRGRSAGVRLHRHHRCAQLPALREHPGALLRPPRRGHPRRRRARPAHLDGGDGTGARPVHRRLVRAGRRLTGATVAAMSSLPELPEWVKSLGLPAVANEAIDRYWKPVWDEIKHELELLPDHRGDTPRPARLPTATGWRSRRSRSSSPGTSGRPPSTRCGRPTAAGT